jgi:hypothetical protein
MTNKAKLYMICPFSEKMGDFSTQQQISEDEYVKMLREYSATIGKGSPLSSIWNRHGVFEINNTQEEKDIESSANVTIFDINGKKCTGDDICNIKKNGMTVLIIEIDDDSMEDSFEDEFKFWKQDSMKINNDKQLSKDDRIRFLPLKDFKLDIDYYLFELKGCKLYHDYNNGKIAIIVQTIKEI